MVGWDELAFALECDTDEVLPAWEAARSVLTATGRWPLVVHEWDGFAGPGWLHRLAEERNRLLVMQAELRYATGDHTLGRSDYVVTVPTAEAALAQRLSAMSDEIGNASGAPGAPGSELSRHLEWPDPPGPPAVILLPVANGWDSLVHFDLGPAGGALGSVGKLIAVLRSWHDRYGAELVANWGTVLQFVVARPPATIDDARLPALEHVAVAPATAGPVPGIPFHHYARTLVGRPTWLLRVHRPPHEEAEGFGRG